MKITYNKSAIMKYAHLLMKTVRDATWSWALKSAWSNAKYMVAWNIKAMRETKYTCDYPVVIADGVTWMPPEDPIWAEMSKYGTD